MKRVFVIGAGVAGCSAALRLAQHGIPVVLAEKGDRVGGRVRSYGCKASDVCNNCGVCLTAGLWHKVEKNELITIHTHANVTGVDKTPQGYTASLETPEGPRFVSGITDAIVCAGLESESNGISAHLQVEGTEGIVTGSEIEALLRLRNATQPMPDAPKRVAFIQCFGSRDKKERAMYCSKVCCSYSTRAAKVLKHYDPDCQITFFYMELQSVANRDYYEELVDEGIDFVKCRPLEINGGKPATIRFDDPENGMTTQEFDMVVLSEGIHPAADSTSLADMLGLQQDGHGFLHTVPGNDRVQVAGCVKKPMKIDESTADAIAAADRILNMDYEEVLWA